MFSVVAPWVLTALCSIAATIGAIRFSWRAITHAEQALAIADERRAREHSRDLELYLVLERLMIDADNEARDQETVDFADMLRNEHLDRVWKRLSVVDRRWLERRKFIPGLTQTQGKQARRSR